jgi:hypothetical protein
MTFSTKIDKIILKFLCSHKRPQIANAALTKKNKVGNTKVTDFKIKTKLYSSKQCCVAIKTNI